MLNSITSKLYILDVIEIKNDNRIVFHNNSHEYEYYLEIIKNEIQQDTDFFCLIEPALEIQIIKTTESILIFIKNRTEYMNLINEIGTSNALRHELNELINGSFDGIVIADNKGKILFQNPSYKEITGLSPEQCIGRKLSDLEKEGVIDVSASLKALKEKRAQTVLQKISTGKTVLVSAALIKDKNNNISKVINNVRDLTYLNQLENDIKNLELKNKKINEELNLLKEQSNVFHSIISTSTIMNNLVNKALKVSSIDSTVLLQGSSGVGKEKFVELIHNNSYRKDTPLIKINCGAIPAELLESELFGYEAGAFTGASSKGKKGLFELANNGTIFLDEIGEMPLHLQVKLLRVIQEREMMRLGGTKAITINVRIIAATNRDLQMMVDNGEFREDLYYRLNVIPISIPDLKDRPDDIMPLILHFTSILNTKYGLNKSFKTEALTMLQKYKWPGNVRELQNIVERLLLLSEGSQVTSDDILREFPLIQSSHRNQHFNKSNEDLNKSLKEIVSDFEKELIIQNLKKYRSIKEAAEHLSLDQSTLVRKIQRYNINKKEIH
ncbi:sigma 54-interacting transcriptional regulator [Lysinibacillus sp. FSL K6-4013]|uniref:sigma-54 interaction domain-containing protein n=1 Tax=Lysinibacillus sp. FSL K6-4013 TaxID=2921504 RepID=UPI00315B0EBB